MKNKKLKATGLSKQKGWIFYGAHIYSSQEGWIVDCPQNVNVTSMQCLGCGLKRSIGYINVFDGYCSTKGCPNNEE